MHRSYQQLAAAGEWQFKNEARKTRPRRLHAIADDSPCAKQTAVAYSKQVRATTKKSVAAKDTDSAATPVRHRAFSAVQ